MSEPRDQTSEAMVDIIAPDANVLIGQSGHHVWVCTEAKGTVFRLKVTGERGITLIDRRTMADPDILAGFLLETLKYATNGFMAPEVSQQMLQDVQRRATEYLAEVGL